MQQHSREIRAAARAFDAAHAGVLTASARQNPNVTLQASNINPHVGIGAGSLQDKTFDTEFRLDYVVERGGKREIRISAATETERASGEDLHDAIRMQRLQLANAYYDLLLAQERVLVAQETNALYAETVSASKRRLDAGDIAASDVDRINVDALRALNDERSALADRQHAQFALAAVLGMVDAAERIAASDAWPASTGVPAQDDVDELLENRPDVRAAKARADAAWHARELAHSQRVRDVAVAVTYDHWPTSSTNMQGTGNSYGFSVSVPLFLGNRFDGEIAKAEADWGVALDQYEKAMALARSELARTRLDLESAQARLRRYDGELIVSAHRVADAQEFAYRRGAIGVIDLLDARRTLRAVQLDAASARADHAKAVVAWQQARSIATQE